MAKLRAKPPAEAKPRKPIVLVYGVAGVGKTFGSLDFPICYYVDTEGGANRKHYQTKLQSSGGAYMGPDDGANDMDVVIEQVQALATSKHNYRTVVIDSASKLFNTSVSIKADEMEDAGRDMDKTFGAEKKVAIRGMRRLIRWLEKADINAILTCHEKDVWKDGKVIGTTFDCWDKLSYELDLVLQITKQGNSRKAKVGKTRLQEFTESEVFDWNYATFAKKYGADVMERQSVSMQPATPEQVEQIKGLVKLIRLDEEQIHKWYEKAGVLDWSEMDSVIINKCITHLTNKLPKSAAVA
jgi:hypothetical protein